MTKLSDTQLLVLSSACQHPDGIATRPATLKPAQAAKVLATLIDRGLAKEMRAKTGVPVWRQDEQGRAIAVKILRAGRQAVDAADEGAGEVNPAKGSDSVSSVATDRATDSAVQPLMTIGGGSKRALIIALMQREQGATIDELIAATDWLPHTTRAALSVLRKGGVSIERSKAERGARSVYRISASSMSAAA